MYKSMIMDFKDLKDGQRINMYVPAMKRFYKMGVTLRTGDDPGAFTISNLGANNSGLIDGHEYMSVLHNQEDVDNFFYMQKEPVTGNEGDTSFEKADAHFAKNNRSWIFGSVHA